MLTFVECHHMEWLSKDPRCGGEKPRGTGGGTAARRGRGYGHDIRRPAADWSGRNDCGCA